jgi:hypothetical protein
MDQTVWVDYGIPAEISASDATWKPLFDNIREFVGAVLKQVAVRETANAICHTLSEVWTWLIWLSGALAWWVIKAVWELLFPDHH